MIIYGKNVIKEAIYAKRPIYHLYIDQKFSDSDFLEFIKKNHINFEFVNKEKLFELAGQKNHQGIVADVKSYEYADITILHKDGIKHVCILDGIEDPQNLGAILRTAETAGMDAIIIGKKQQVPLNATVAKVSSGAIEHVPVIEVTNINWAIEQLKAYGFWIIGTDGSAVKTYHEMPKSESLAVILGNEGSGMRPLVRKNCDMLVKIPMHGKINSLNVSVAAALMMYAMIE